jgi:hypothetical protein
MITVRTTGVFFISIMQITTVTVLYVKNINIMLYRLSEDPASVVDGCRTRGILYIKFIFNIKNKKLYKLKKN